MTSRIEPDDAAIDELLGAFALDALDPDEADAVERYLARTPAAAAEVQQLRTAAAWIGATEALAPPVQLRASIIEAARAQSARGSSDTPLTAYLTEAARLDELAGEIPADARGRITANGLGVHELVIHLAAMESLLAATLGEPVESDIDETDIERRTAQFVEQYRDRSVDDARATLRRSVEAVRRWAEDPANATADVTCFGLMFTRDNLLLMRSFETWTHADDIRRVLDRPSEPPEPRILHRMADLSVTALPIALEITDRAHRGKSARVVLTGPGGGSWLLALGRGEPTEPPNVVVTADTIEWCLLVAERLTPEAFRCTVAGDAEIARDLTAAASAFTTL